MSTKKRRRKKIRKDNQMIFYNSTNKEMNFDEMFDEMIKFMRYDPKCFYKIRIGTDSQVKKDTLFVTAVHIHRIGADSIGKGAWGALKDYYMPRRITSLREKISTETSLSQELTCMFSPEYLDKIADILIPHVDEGADFDLKIHIDIGEKGPTREFISEMVGRVKSMGLEAEIKPDSYAASGYANYYTK